MKFYIAAPWGEKDKARELMGKVRDSGHEIEADWTGHVKPEKSEKSEEELAKQQIEKDLTAAKSCDIFVLVSNKRSRGSHMEFGTAVTSMIENGRPEVYVIGEFRDSYQFYRHPEVKRREDIEEVIEEVED